MERLSLLDASFLDAEDGDPRTSMAIASAAVFGGPVPSRREFVDALRLKLPHIPRYRQKVHRVPFNLHRPVWVDDQDFDIDYHIRRIALPAPGGDEELAALMGLVMSQRLDRDHPLWEYWIVEGLADGHWALISKLHHCMVDGVSGTHLYSVICDGQVAGVDEPWRPGPRPSPVRLVADAALALAVDPLGQARRALELTRDPRAFAGRVSATARGLGALTSSLRPPSPTSLTGSLGRQRRYAAVRASFADLRTIKTRYGCTVNDVVLAAIAGAYRRLLLSRDERPDARAVRSLVPVSVRAPGEEGQYENQVSLLLPFLPVHIADPVTRLLAVHKDLAALKAGGEADAGKELSRLGDHELYGPLALGLRALFAMPPRTVTTVTTNVPGPREPLTLLGRPLLEILPYVPISTMIRTGVAICTYHDRVAFGVTADYTSVPDLALLARGIEEELDLLVKAAADSAAG
jgi:diacylglycerol O-acyltransferase / wax synthase